MKKCIMVLKRVGECDIINFVSGIQPCLRGRAANPVTKKGMINYDEKQRKNNGQNSCAL